MNKVMNPTREEWLKSTSELLVQHEKKIATYQRDGSEVPEGLSRVVAEIRDTIEQRSKWTERDFRIWRNAPVMGEVGHEEYKRNYPDLQPVWEEFDDMERATMTVETNMIDAVVAIDKLLGQGFAREHPKLIGALMQEVGTVYAGETIARQIGAGFDGIAEALHAANINSDLGAIDENVRAGSPLRAEGFDGISGALRELVEATQNIAAICQQMPKRYE